VSGGFALAQVNLALAREPLDAPLLAEFMAALAPVNARADAAPGFVWRMQTEGGDATAVRGFGDDPQLIINLTVWASLEAMRDFVYRDPEHLAIMRRRREMFERLDLHTALWWVPAGHRPDVAEAEERMEHLRVHGPTPHAFSFREHFGAGAVEAERDDRWLCPA
jgi:heme-degrading monooxygenase HmoA